MHDATVPKCVGIVVHDSTVPKCIGIVVNDATVPKCVGIVVHDAVEVVSIHNALHGLGLLVELDLVPLLQEEVRIVNYF